MSEPTILLPRPLPHQREFLLSPARHKVLVAGRKWGKSLTCLTPLLDGHGPGACLQGAAHGAKGAWIAPTIEISRVIWDALKDATVGAWTEKHEIPSKITFPGGGSIVVRSAHDPDSLRGPNYDFVVMDEAAMLHPDTWSKVLEPTLAAPPSGRPGWAIFISTPAGVENWFRKVYDDAATRPGWARWQRPSSDNPVIAREFLEEKQATVSSYVWRQEYLAEFVSAAGGLFKREDARYYRVEGDEYVLPAGQIVYPRDMQRFVTVDTATSTRDAACFTACMAWGIDTHGHLVLLELDLARIEGAEIMRRILAMCQRWECTAWIEENSTSKHLLSLMESEGIPFRTVTAGSQDKWTRAQEAVALWERHMVLIPERAAWLEGFERQLYNFEPKGNDSDSVDAFAYAARIMRDEFTPSGSLLSAMVTSRRPKQYLPPGIAASGPSPWDRQ